MVQPPAEDLSYQWALRGLGAYLDQEAPNARFTLVEVPDGFTLLLSKERGGPPEHELHFPYGKVVEQLDNLARGRKLLGSKYQGGWPLSPTGRQDFFRALGYELDDSQARGILLDELENGVLLTYSFINASEGYQYRKRLLTLEVDDIGAIIKTAYARRHKRGLLRR